MIINAKKARELSEETKIKKIRINIENSIKRAISDGRTNTNIMDKIPDCIEKELINNGYSICNNQIRW